MKLDHIPLISGAVGWRGHMVDLERDRFALLDRWTHEVDHIGRLRFFTRDMIVANSPSSIHEVLVEKARAFEKSPLLRIILYPLAGEGLFTSGGALWRRQRRLMAPVFHQAKIDAFADTMVDSALRVCSAWADGAQLDLARETTHITMAVAGRTLFGMDTLAESDELAAALTTALLWGDHASNSMIIALQVELRVALTGFANGRLQSGAFERLLHWLEAPIPWPTRKNRELARAIAQLDALVQRMIDDRRAAPAARNDLLDHLLRARDEDDGALMTDKQVRDEILTLFVAGHETTANGLAWALYLLARHPEAYARAQATVDALGGRPATLSDLPRLEFLSRVFKEALRLYPPVYFISRIAIADTTLAGYAIPKGSMVVLSPWALQRRPDLWPDPTRFDPDRFLPAAQAARPRDAWIPFSDGPRVCIGAHFAQIEGPLVLATLLQRADFALLDDREIPPDPASGTLRPLGGVPMRVKFRSPTTRYQPSEAPLAAGE